MRMFTKAALVSLSTVVAFSARCQDVYSINAVGYINQNIYTGDNLIANQLSASPENSLDSVFPAGSGVLPGSTFSEWDPTVNQLMPWSVYDGTSWSINYNLSPNGVGGVLDSPGNTVVTSVGNVVNVNLSPQNNSIPFYTFVPPALGAGTYLLTAAAPIDGATFNLIIGRAPLAGESVETLDAATQTYTTTTFNGTTWNNGAPSLAIDQAAYFDLVVPEPCTFFLGGLGAALLMLRARYC